MVDPSEDDESCSETYDKRMNRSRKTRTLLTSFKAPTVLLDPDVRNLQRSDPIGSPNNMSSHESPMGSNNEESIAIGLDLIGIG